MHRAAAQRDYGIRPPDFRLPDETRLGPVRLQVADIARSTAFYQRVLGFEVIQDDRQTARLRVPAAADHLVELRQRSGAKPVPRAGVLGLYHFAILLPARAALGRFVRHLVEAGAQFAAADHLVSEAVYLWDPDGLGIEVYADRPREAWRSNGRELTMTTERLDVQNLMQAGGAFPWDGLPTGTTLGHMHLSVGDLAAARRFYHDALGFELTVWSYPGALFMSAGGYHHHLGANTWAPGARLATENDARLLEWQLTLPRPADVQSAETSLRAAGYDVRDGVATDPWGTDLRLTPSLQSM
jgi:catechol 2,3-dioxygenase